jgi:hypothetical protein
VSSRTSRGTLKSLSSPCAALGHEHGRTKMIDVEDHLLVDQNSSSATGFEASIRPSQ